MHSLAEAFRRVFLAETGLLTVPSTVDTAVKQAVTVTAHDLLDRPGLDLRTQVLPTFYRAVSRTHCALGGPGHDHGSDPHTG